jgi:hypothetical protein
MAWKQRNIAATLKGRLGSAPSAMYARSKLTEELVAALLRDFRDNENGYRAIQRVRQEAPAVYLKVLAMIVPKEHHIEHTDAVTGLSDSQLDAMIATLQNQIDQRLQGKAIPSLIEQPMIDVADAEGTQTTVHMKRSKRG